MARLPVAVAVAVLLIAPSAQAASTGAAPAVARASENPFADAFRAWSDLRPTLIDAQVAAEAAQAHELCPTKPLKAKPISLAAALRNAQGFVGKASAAMRKLRANRDYRSLAGVRKLEAGVAAAGVPMEELALSLREHQLAPRDPDPLINAAGLVAEAGMPREALALLDGADRLHGRPSSPAGISGKAISLNNRGFALLLEGRYAAARKALDRAAKLAPLLSEARTNSSAADVCEARTLAVYSKVHDEGRFRRGPSKPPIEIALQLPPQTFVVPLTFPTPPGTLIELGALEQGGNGPYLQMSLRLLDEERTAFANLQAANARYRPSFSGAAVFGAVSPFFVLGDVSLGGALKPLAVEGDAIALYLDTGKFDEDAGAGPPYPDCSEIADLAARHACSCANEVERYRRFRVAYNSHVPAWEQWARKYANAAYSYAAAFKDPDARTIIISYAENQIAHVEDYLAGAIYNQSGCDMTCALPPPAPEPETGTDASIPDDPCPFAERPLKSEIAKVMTIKLSCEEVSVDIHSPGPSQVFSRWSRSFKNHTTTYVLGGRAVAKIPGVIKVSDEAGISITEDTKTGRITDTAIIGLNIKVEPSAAVSYITGAPEMHVAAQFGGFQTQTAPTSMVPQFR